MEIKTKEKDDFLKIEKIVSKKRKKQRSLVFLTVCSLGIYIFFLFNEAISTILSFIFLSPLIYAFYRVFLSPYRNETIKIENGYILFYYENLYNYKRKLEIKSIEKIYWKEDIPLFYMKGIVEAPWCRVHFLTKDNDYCGWGIKISKEEAEAVILVIQNFLKKQKLKQEKENRGNIEKKQYETWEKLNLSERYSLLLKDIVLKENIYCKKEENIFYIEYNGEKGMNFYQFYLDYLSNKEYENSRVRVADNGRDCKEVSMKQVKEDINKLRDEK